MDILEKLENSYNREVQKKVLAQLNVIDEASKKYIREKIKFRLIFLEKANPLATELNREKAMHKNFRSESRNKLRKVKMEFKGRRAEVKENYHFDLKEANLSLSLIKKKIQSNYQKARREYIQAYFSNKLVLKDKLAKFDQDFKVYFDKEMAERLNHRDETIKALKQKYLEDIDKIKKQYQIEVKEIKKSSLRVNKKAFKAEKKAIIAKLATEIKALKQEMKEQDKANRSSLKQFKKETQIIKRKARKEIRNINKETRNVVNKMSAQERKEFTELQKYINEDFCLRRRAKIDQKEALILKKINPAYIYIAPAVFGEVFFTLFPFIFMIIGSLFRVNFTNLSKSRWVGLQNFIRIFTKDVEFQKAIYNTVIYSLFTVILLTVVTISMAAWLAKNTKIHNLAQTMVFTPHIASLVSISILWIAMLNPNGIINQILAVFNIKGPAWLLQENTSLFSVSLVTVWKDIGYYVLIIISGLQGIPAYVYEAAKLDKASKSRTFFNITIPLLAPTLSFVFITKFINSFKVFAPIEIMTNGGPMGSSMVLSYWVYKVGRIGFNYGQAMAGAIILTLMIAICTFINNRYLRRIVRY